MILNKLISTDMAGITDGTALGDSTMSIIFIIGVWLYMSTHQWDWNVIHVWHYKHPLQYTQIITLLEIMS